MDDAPARGRCRMRHRGHRRRRKRRRGRRRSRRSRQQRQQMDGQVDGLAPLPRLSAPYLGWFSCRRPAGLEAWAAIYSARIGCPWILGSHPRSHHHHGFTTRPPVSISNSGQLCRSHNAWVNGESALCFWLAGWLAGILEPQSLSPRAHRGRVTLGYWDAGIQLLGR